MSDLPTLKCCLSIKWPKMQPRTNKVVTLSRIIPRNLNTSGAALASKGDYLCHSEMACKKWRWEVSCYGWSPQLEVLQHVYISQLVVSQDVYSSQLAVPQDVYSSELAVPQDVYSSHLAVGTKVGPPLPQLVLRCHAWSLLKIWSVVLWQTFVGFPNPKPPKPKPPKP